MTFEKWWDDIGSQGPTKEDMHNYDQEEWTKLKCNEAWDTATIDTEMKYEKVAYEEYIKKQKEE